MVISRIAACVVWAGRGGWVGVFNAMESVHVNALVQLRTKRMKRERERERKERERGGRAEQRTEKEQEREM